MNNYLLGKYVKDRRESMGLSLREFGDLCKISHTTIDVIEKGYDPRTGKPVNITNATFGKLAQGMNEPVSKLVALSEGIQEPQEVNQSSGLHATRYDELSEKNKEIINQMIETLVKSQSVE